MSTHIEGIVCYGILFDEGFVFPWDKKFEEEDEDDEVESGDIDEWWEKVNGYTNPHEVTDWSANTRQQNLIDKYYDYKNTWKKEHPLPVELVNMGSDIQPIYILAVAGTVQTGYNHEPKEFHPPSSMVDASQLLEFCKKFNIPIQNKAVPKWYIGCYDSTL